MLRVVSEVEKKVEFSIIIDLYLAVFIMPITDNFTLPTEEELTVQEINLTTSSLRAGAYYFGKYCEEANKEFMLCKIEEMDPRKCLNDGKQVTSCGLEFFRKVKGTCRKSFEAYAHCIDSSSNTLSISPCRKTQVAYDLCMMENFGMERPELGYYATPKVHTTTRPKPEHFPQRKQEPVPELPDDFPREPAVGGNRYFFFN